MTDPAKPVVLAVDDAADLLALIGRALATEYKVKLASDGEKALALAAEAPVPELILLDVGLPGMSGFEVCRRLKGHPATAHVPVVFLTGKAEASDQVEGLDLGAVDYIAKPVNAKLLLARVRTQLALANRQAELERQVAQRTAQLEDARVQLIHGLARALEFHESAAAGNRGMRVAQYVKLLSLAAGAKPEQAEIMMKAAPLYDIGKMGVPSEILRKAGKLSAPDLERVKRHPQLGAEIIGEHKDPVLALARTLALTHHERWDGTGYPRGLRGNDIPMPGRIMALADAFESMTSTQFYRPEPFAADEAASALAPQFGKQFDPALAPVLAKALPEMRRVRETIPDKLSELLNLDFSPPAGGAKAPDPEEAARAALRAARSPRRR